MAQTCGPPLNSAVMPGVESVMQPIRIMHLLPNLNVGGMENGVVNLANHINREKFSISICCLNTEGPLKARLTRTTKVFDMAQEPGKAFNLAFQLARLFKREKVDIVHTHNSYSAVYGIPAARLVGTPVVIHGEHGTIDFLQGYRRHLKKFVCSLSHRITTVSECIKDDVEKLWEVPPSRISVLPNGVDCTKFYRYATTSYKMNDPDDLTNEIILGSVGRLSDQKNYPLLLEAMKAAIQRKPNLRLWLVGNGPLRAELTARASELGISGHVDFLGERTDVPDLLNKMDMFVLPSYTGEGMANCILEAMAVGLPVIASDIAGNLEIVQDHKTGLLFPSKNLPELVDRIVTMSGDPAMREKMGSAAMDRIRESFSMQRMVDRYEQLYARLMDQ